MSRRAFPTGIDRRPLLGGALATLLPGCGDRTPAPVPAQSTVPAASEPVLRTTLDGRPVISFAGLRYAVRPPLGWRTKPLVPRGQENGPEDVVVLASPAAATDPIASDTQISLEAFRKSDRAPTFEAKLDNIAADRRRLRPQFVVERELPMALDGGKRAQVYRMYNTPAGDSEALAFVDEGQVVAEMVLVAKTRAAFEANLPLFREMVRTYQRIA